MNNIPISVLTRTHKRPNALRVCLNSLDMQTKKNFSVVIISDYEKDNVELLAHEYPNLDFKFMYVNPLGYPGCNLYFNQIKNYINSDYVIFIDDNDTVIDNTYLQTLEYIFNMKQYPVIMSRSQFPGRIIPSDNVWGLPPVAGNICTLNYCVRTDIYRKGNWTDAQIGDFHFIKSIYDIIDWQKDVLWYNKITVKVGDTLKYGKSEY